MDAIFHFQLEMKNGKWTVQTFLGGIFICTIYHTILDIISAFGAMQLAN